MSNGTNGREFRLTIYGKQKKHYDNYGIFLNDEGWYVSFLTRHGQCNPRGEEVLYKVMDNEMVDYPRYLPSMLAYLWLCAKESNLTDGEIQRRLDELAEWINNTTHSYPDPNFWQGA